MPKTKPHYILRNGKPVRVIVWLGVRVTFDDGNDYTERVGGCESCVFDDSECVPRSLSGKSRGCLPFPSFYRKV